MTVKQVSIIIRCKNEEDWISHCLSAVYSQKFSNFEVIIVDSGSTDDTIRIVKSFDVDKIVHLDYFKPGYAINEGIKVSHGKFIVILSAHCVPKDGNWLGNLINNLRDKDVAGVYGRQLPVAYSGASDVRDLFITFGLDRRVQVKDYFFHNANSAISRAVWEKHPFDNEATNIEDRIWAKEAINSGYKLIYEPESEVYHHHGIHHGQSEDRRDSTFKILKQVENFDNQQLLPESLKPESRDIAALVPIRLDLEKKCDSTHFKKLIDELERNAFINHVFIIAESSNFDIYNASNKVSSVTRPSHLNKQDVSLGEVLKWSLGELNYRGYFPEYVVYANPDYIFRPSDIFNNLIKDACYKGLDSVFFGYTEYSSYWLHEENSDNYIPFGEGLAPRSEKKPLYKSLFGLGSVVRSRIIRQGKFFDNKKVGVISTDDFKYTLRISDSSMENIARSILHQSD